MRRMLFIAFIGKSVKAGIMPQNTR